MKNKSLFVVLIFSLLLLISSCSITKDEIEIYSFSGENEIIAINNGLIIVNTKEEKFIGGKIAIKEEKLFNIKDSTVKYVFIKNGTQETIQVFTEINEGLTEGRTLVSDTGSTSSENLFSIEDIESIVDSLVFIAEGTFFDGSNFYYELPIDVNRVY